MNQNNLMSVSLFLLKNTALAAVFGVCFSVTGCGNSDKQSEPIFTELDKLLVDSSNPCKSAISSLGNELIGDKKHYLQTETLVVINKDDAGDIQKLDLSNNSDIALSGILQYRDRPAHIRFDAHKVSQNTKKVDQCIVGYQLDYQLDTSCMTAREEAFKKWNEVGTLGDNTRYFVYKRDPNKKAYLTNISRNIQCLVSVRNTQIVAITD